MLSPSLLVVHDARRCGEDDVAELTRRQQLDDPLLHVAQLDVESRADDTAPVDAAIELDNDLAVAVVIDFLKLANVAWTELSVCRNRLNDALQRGIRQRVRSLHAIAQSSGHLKGKGRVTGSSRPLPSYQPGCGEGRTRRQTYRASA